MRPALFLFVALLAAPCAAQTPSSPVAGKWTLAVLTSTGPEARTLQLSVDAAGKVTGTVGSQYGDVAISGGRIAGNHLTLDFSIAGGQIRITYDGTIARDTLRGMWRQDQSELPLVGVRGEPTGNLALALRGPQLGATDRASLITALKAAITRSYAVAASVPRIVSGIDSLVATGRYDTLTIADSFALALTRDLRRYDKHFSIFTLQNRVTPERATGAASNFAFRAVERLDGNVGYIRFDAFTLDTQAAHEMLTSALTFLARTDALILDLRENRGGSGATSNLIAAHFLERSNIPVTSIYRRRDNYTDSSVTPQLPAGDTRYLRPLYILTSPRSASAAEWFAYTLQALGRATVIGEPSAGAAHPIEAAVLDKTFGANIPFGIATSLITKKDIEGVGVRPDSAVASAEALTKAHRTALEVLKARTTDAFALAEIERALRQRGV